jgi:mannose-6-phosphate isomerase-like protein (cupin superfamily)
LKPINLAELLSSFHTRWDPKIIGQLNGQHVKLVKLEGEFIWHAHADADELFLVLEGSLDMQYRDHTVTVSKGELVIVPRGVEHCPRAESETHALLFEPAGTLNTGDAGGDRTVADPEFIHEAI